jgi:uncharacterized membrane protein
MIVGVIASLAGAGRDCWRAQGLDKALPLGRVLLAMPMAVFGAEHLANPSAMMSIVPVWMPGRLFWTYFVGAALVAATFSIIFRIAIRWSAALLGIMLLCFVAMIHLPNAIATPQSRIVWTIVARDSSFGAGAILLAIVSSADRKLSAAKQGVALSAFYWIALVCVFFGIEHFFHPECVPAVPLAKVVPAWIPLGHFWTILTGILLVSGGIAMNMKPLARQAAAVLGVWVLLLVLTLYLAIMLSKPDIEGLNYFADTMVFAGVLLVASQAAPRGSLSS